MKITCHIEGGPEITVHDSLADDLLEYLKEHCVTFDEHDHAVSIDVRTTPKNEATKPGN